jgi:hypothetical protein
VYHIFFTARDGSGGSCSAEAVVAVRFYATQPAVDNYPGVNKNALDMNPQ